MFSDNVLKIGVSLRQLETLSQLWLQNCDHNDEYCVCLYRKLVSSFTVKCLTTSNDSVMLIFKVL